MTRTATPDTTAPAYGMTRADARLAPWNVMSGGLSMDHTDLDLALMEAGLDYETRTVPVAAQPMVDAEGRPVGAFDLEVPKHRAVVRPRPGNMGDIVVGLVGTRFTPIQNRYAFGVAGVLTAEHGARIVGAADYHNLQASILVVAMGDLSVRLPNGQPDQVDLNLVIRNDHSGNGALVFALTPLRPECTNMLQSTLDQARRTWKMSHTPNALERVALARQAILSSITYRDQFQATAQAMADQAMTDAEFDKIVQRLWPVAEGKDETKAGRRALEIRDEVRGLYATSETIGAARGTLWGGYNAITEWFDWGRQVRGGDVSRAEGALEGPYVRTKDRVWGMFAAAAN